jgi:Kef-type K+ transport system membrane component KefB
MSYLSGRLRTGEPTQLEAVGAVLVCGGLAIWVGASYLLAATVAGTLVANLSKNAEQTFSEIEHFEWPFLTVFFVLAGAMLNLPMALAAGVLGLAYLGFRLLGRLVGGVTGALMSRESADRGMWMGLGLLPQAGVAVGMALLAAAEFPDYGETILAITIGGTVIFEICGPVLTRIAQRRSPD